MLPDVEVVHVDERNRISILVVVQKYADLIKRELYVKARRLLVQFVIHGDLHDRVVSSGCIDDGGIDAHTFPSPETGFRMNWWGAARLPLEICPRLSIAP